MLPKDTLDCHFFGQFFVLNFLMRKAEWIFSLFYLYQKIRVSMVSIANSSWYVNYKTGNSFDDPSLISAAVAAILQVVELNTNHYDIMKRDFNALHDKCRPISILLVMLLGDSEKIRGPLIPSPTPPRLPHPPTYYSHPFCYGSWEKKNYCLKISFHLFLICKPINLDIKVPNFSYLGSCVDKYPY